MMDRQELRSKLGGVISFPVTPFKKDFSLDKDPNPHIHYVTRWRRMLSGPVPRIAASLLRDDDWADALFQNSPFGFALGPPAP